MIDKTTQSETIGEKDSCTIQLGLATGFSNNHRVYPPELLEKIRNTPLPDEIKNIKFLGEHPHE